MHYLDRYLAANETIIFRGRYHWWFDLKSIGLLNLFNEVLVTDRRVLRKSGIISVNIYSLSFDALEERFLHQSLLGRIFGFGDVRLHGNGGQTERYTGLANPSALLHAIDLAARNVIDIE